MNLLALGIVGVVGFVLTVAILTMLIVPPDRMFAALVEWQTKVEMATPSTANSGNDLTMMVARKIARKEMQDADPETAAQIEAFLERTEDKSLVDIGRDNMRGFILFEASAEGYPEIGEAAVARLDRCKTPECLAFVEFEFKEELRAAKSAS